jgi:hypothetical protein
MRISSTSNVTPPGFKSAEVTQQNPPITFVSFRAGSRML